MLQQNDNTIWVERYRPTSLEYYIGNEGVKQKLQSYIDNQDLPHLLFYGTAGTGKTTAAQILTKNIDADVLMINASSENGVEVIRQKIKNFASTMGFKPLKIIFLDEADFVTPEAQAALRNLMEAFSKNTRFILTCNYVERIIDPIVSRSQVFQLTPPSKKEVAQHLIKILETEGVTYEKQSVVHLINAYYPDVRRIIGSAQQNTHEGKLSINVEALVASDFKLRVLDTLMTNLPTDQKVNTVRQIVADADVKDYTEMYRLLFEKVDDYASHNISQTILAIAEGQYRDNFVPDKEINFIATIYNIFN